MNFSEKQVVFVAWEQGGVINQYHIAKFFDSGTIITSCGMVITGSAERPTLSTIDKPAEIKCCPTCHGTKLRAFLKKYFDGNHFGLKKQRQPKMAIADEMLSVSADARSANEKPQESEQGPVEPGHLF